MIGIYKFDFCLCGGQIYMASDKDQKKKVSSHWPCGENQREYKLYGNDPLVLETL